MSISTSQYHVIAFLLVPFLLYLLRFRPHHWFTNDLTEDELAVMDNPRDRSLFDATSCILEKEILLVTVDVLSAVIDKWLVVINVNKNITSLNLYQWFIEATWAPVVIGNTDVVTLAIHLNNMETRSASDYRMAMVIRYAESNPASCVNDLIAFLFRITCRSVEKTFGPLLFRVNADIDDVAFSSDQD